MAFRHSCDSAIERRGRGAGAYAYACILLNLIDLRGIIAVADT